MIQKNIHFGGLEPYQSAYNFFIIQRTYFKAVLQNYVYVINKTKHYRFF